jgi:class 3 adenylate cyclase/tetratricopeptide (TPR) repeat protein
MRCGKCNTENPEGMKFCGNCAAPLGNRCARCGFDNPAEFKFCGQCGSALGASAARPAARPPQEPTVSVVEDQSAVAATDGERKTVTALFADIKGSMDLMEGIDPEEARAIVDPALALMIEAVRRYDGYIVQSTGDGIFAMFGAPVAHEDHAQRSLYAALRMQDEMRRYSARLREAGNPPVEIRVGVNTGEVVVRSIRTGAHAEYTPIGHATSLAARMQTLAPTGAVAVTEATQKLTAGFFEYRSLGPTRVKGVSDPVLVYEVVGMGPLRTRLEVSAARGLSKFVGRQAEMGQLRRALELARAGHGQIVAAVAEAGVGKSRLFHEFKLTSATACAVLEAFSVSHGKASAYLPVIELLRDYFRIGAQDDERTRREKITGKVLALDRALEDTLPFISSLLGFDESEALEGMDSSIRRRRTRDAIKSLILRESLNQPLIVVFEDLHWIDDETQGLLDILADSIGTARVLLMVNYRPEYHHQWVSKTYYTQLRLDPLGRDMADEMLSALVGDADELRPLKQMIAGRTEGNPFFIEEMVQVLFDEGVLERDEGVVTMQKPIGSVHIPPTVRGILASRIDRLGAAEKELLQTLAIIGKEFPMGLVRRVTGKSDDALLPLLQNLQLGEFIYEQPAFPDSEYTFKHALTQEVAAQSMLIERRHQIHERTAAAIEAMYAHKIDDHLGELAHHYSQSSNLDKAINFLFRAGEQGYQRSTYDEALRHTREALRLVATQPDSRERDLAELRLLMLLGPMLVATQGFNAPELMTVLSRSQALVRRAGERPEIFSVLFGLWSVQFASGQMRDGLATAEHLLTLAERVQQPMALGGANSSVGSSLTWLGDFERARVHLERACEIYDSDMPLFLPSSKASVIPSRCQLTWALWMLGFPDQAKKRSEEALALARRLNRPFSTAFALTYSIATAARRRETAGIRQSAEGLIELAREHGFPYWSAVGKMSLGCAIADEGDVELGLQTMLEGMRALESFGADLIYCYALSLLADVYRQVGQTDDGLRAVDAGLERVEAKDQRLAETELYRLRGLLMLQRPSGKEAAIQAFRRSLEVAKRQHALSMELRTAMDLARVIAGDGAREDARSLVEPIYARFTEGFSTPDLKDAAALLSELR